MSVLAQGLEVLEVTVAAPAGHAADVTVGHGDDAHIVGNLGALLEDALTTVAEVVDRHGELSAEEVEVHADVELLGLLPHEVVGTHAVFGQDTRAAPGGSVGLLLDDCQVGEAQVGDAVVSDQTVRGADLHEVEPLDALEEFVLRGNPSDGHGGEESVLLAAAEVFRTVQTEVQVDEVGVAESVGEASREALVTLGDGIHRAVGTRFDRAFEVVEEQAADAVVAEGAVVVDLGVEVELAPVPCLGVVLYGGFGNLLREHQLTVLVAFAGQVEGRHAVAAFAEEVLRIPRSGSLGAQSLGDHVERLLHADVEERAALVLHGVARIVEQHVGRDVAVGTRGGQLAARIAQRVHQRRGLGLRIPEPVGQRGVQPAVGLAHARALVHRHVGRGTQVDLRGLREVDVDVRAEVVGVVADALVVFAVAEALVGRALLRHAQTGEVAGDASAALHAEVLRMLERDGVEDLLLPVDVGVEVGVETVADDLHLRVVIDAAHARSGGGFVGHFGILQGADVFGQAAQLGDGVVRTEGDLELLLLAALGCYENHAVGTAAAVYGRCGGILEDRETLDVGGVDLAQVALQAVDEHQGAAVGAERADTADPEFRNVASRLAARLDGDDARDTSAERIDDVRGGHFELRGIDDGHGARNADLALRAHTYDDDLLEFVALLEGDLHFGVGGYELLDAFVSHERDDQRVVEFGREVEPAFGVGDGAYARLILDVDRSTDDGDIVRIDDLTFRMDRRLLLVVLGACLHGECEQESAYQ